MRLEGVGGTLRHGYYLAAQIRTWALDYDPNSGHGQVTVTLGTTDTFRLTQAPLALTLDLPGRAWVWPTVTEVAVIGRVSRMYRVTGQPESVRSSR